MDETNLVNANKQPSITINIQSWATPIVGVLMLIVGLFGGYYGRPLIVDGDGSAVSPQTIAPVQPQGEEPGNEELMDYLVSQARHFSGDPDAAVTLVEFGDFQ